MVNMDGFVLTHATERIDVPTQEQVDAFLPPFEPRQVLDPADPGHNRCPGGPEAFTEVRFLAHAKQLQAIGRIPRGGPTSSPRPSAGVRAAWSTLIGSRMPTSS